MRHRIIQGISIGGNSEPELLNNEWSNNNKLNEILKECFYEGIDTFKFLKELNGCDFNISNNEIKFGYEPAYMNEQLFIICINLENKESSYIKRGKAWGVYGSGIASTTKYYEDYKNKSKFVNFVDKWHEKIINIKGENL